MRWKLSIIKQATLLAIAALIMTGTSSRIAWGQASPPACENGNCFAVFVMPDTQHYVYGQYNNDPQFEERGALHLRRIMDWVCENKGRLVAADSLLAVKVVF